MKSARIVIVGGGLAGLYAAWLLERRGIDDYVVFEARDVLGGRILSSRPEGDVLPIDRFDLGPTWFWPDFQPELDRLVRELGLARFAQYQQGDILVERSPGRAPLRYPPSLGAVGSMRLEGGMGALIDALHEGVDPARVLTGKTVQAIRATWQQPEADVEDGTGATETWTVGHVLLAMPPGLAARTVRFSPELPSPLLEQWRATPTWMAPHAKYIAVYDAPFWRGQGLSGTAQSTLGPLMEIHDASMPGGSAALFGFLGVPARVRKSVPDDALRTLCRAHLARLFGPEAATPRAEFFKDWATDPYTATDADREAGQHANAPAAEAGEGPWLGRLIGIASEWSPQYPGYLAGAIEAARLAVERLHVADAPRPRMTERS